MFSYSSRIGTIRGGSETMRGGSPSISSVSREKAFRLSFVRALAAVWAKFFASALSWKRRSRSSISVAFKLAYQTSRLPIEANSAIASR